MYFVAQRDHVDTGHPDDDVVDASDHLGDRPGLDPLIGLSPGSGSTLDLLTTSLRPPDLPSFLVPPHVCFG